MKVISEQKQIHPSKCLSLLITLCMKKIGPNKNKTGGGVTKKHTEGTQEAEITKKYFMAA